MANLTGQQLLGHLLVTKKKERILYENKTLITMSEGQEFLKECKEVREDFVAIAGLYTVDEHLVLRTKIDSLLIMYNQLCERVRLADSSNENSGLCKNL